jgi:anaerobic selenocysteine-containing dehydrogenase
MVTAPARNYLNSTFTETPTSIAREKRPTAKVHPDDAATLGIEDGARVRIGNERGSVLLHAELFDGLRRGTIVVESVWPNHAFEEGVGINLLTSSDSAAPIGGGLYHDTSVWLKAE